MVLLAEEEVMKGWRTVIYNFFTGVSAFVLGILAVLESFDLTTLFEPKTAAIILLAAKVLDSVINVVLRWNTTTEIGKKESDSEPEY